MYSRHRKNSRAAAAVTFSLLLYAAPLYGEEYVVDRDEAVRRGTARSFELETAELRLAARKRRYSLGIRDYLPRLELGISFDDAVTLHGADSRSKRISAAVEQPLYNGGASRFSRKVEEMEIGLEEVQLRLQRVALADTIWKLCSEIIILEQKAEIEKKLIALNLRNLSLHRLRHRLGLVPELEVVELEIQVQSAKIRAAETGDSISKLHYTVKQLLGVPADSKLSIDDTIDSNYRGIQLHGSPDYFIETALRNNPELLFKHSTVRKEEQAAILARKTYVPALSLEASFFVEGEHLPLHIPGFSVQFHIDFSHPAMPGSMTGSIGNTGPDRVSRGLHIRSSPLRSIDAAAGRIEGDIARAAGKKELEKLEADLSFTVRQTFEGYRRQQERVRLASESRRLIQKKLDILKQRLDDGSIRSSAYIEAEIEYEGSTIEILEQILALLTTERQLETLLGLAPGNLAEFTGNSGGTGGIQ